MVVGVVLCGGCDGGCGAAWWWAWSCVVVGVVLRGGGCGAV